MLPPDPAALDRLRRSLALRMDGRGRFFVGGEPVTHPRVEQMLRHGIDLSDGGEPIVRWGDQWAYLEVDDCPLRATAIDADPDDGARLVLHLDDGRTAALDPAGLAEESGMGLHCTAPARSSGRPLAVRLTNRAALDLAPHLELEDELAFLRLGARRTPIPHRPAR